MTKNFKTKSGLEIAFKEEKIALDGALDPVFSKINHQKGAIFSSGFDYPGRHSRWDIGFINPALEICTYGRECKIHSLNDQGKALLGLIQPVLEQHPHVATVAGSADGIEALIKPFPEYFTEEERSRQPSVFSVLRALNELFACEDPTAGNLGLYGAFGYDLVMQFEDIVARHTRDGSQADCHLFLPLEMFLVDRKQEVASRISYSIETPEGPTDRLSGGGVQFEPQAGSGSEEIESDHQSGEFSKKVAQIIEGTKRGDYFEVVISQAFSTRFDGKPTELFRRLAKVNPSPYMFLIQFGNEQLIGASPEIYTRVTGRRYETCPIAGTVPRGKTALEDADRVRELLNSQKDESELTMCTDVDRNDMARVCEPGSVKIIGRRQLEFYSHLIHTVDHLEGTLLPDCDALDAFQTHMWACTVTGAPKPAALQAIEDFENSPRAWYSGAIGFLSFSGNLNTGITLRTAHLKDGRATVRAGATLLYDSDPIAEEEETRTKAAAFLKALSDLRNEKTEVALSKAPRVQPLAKTRKVLLVDCRDSFVHNLAAYIRELGCEVITLRSGFPLNALDEISPDFVLLSPGPGTPQEFGVPDLVGTLVERNLPTFGVCLGHQGIGQHFGATIGQLPLPVHGKPSLVTHEETKLFAGVAKEFEAGRYHSLYLVRDSIPEDLEVTAYTMRLDEDGTQECIPMAVEHKTLPIAGVQFHPESLLTLKNTAGHQILRNALETLK